MCFPPGFILASGATGAPVVASHAPEWLAKHLLSPTGLFITRHSLAASLSRLAPVQIQAFYNTNLEAFFSDSHAAIGAAESALPSPLVVATILAFDVALALWFLGWVASSAFGAAELGAALLALSCSRGSRSVAWSAARPSAVRAVPHMPPTAWGWPLGLARVRLFPYSYS